jgi:hypothetical protein
MALQKKNRENHIIYFFSVLNSVRKSIIEEGTGNKYIRSRLSENYHITIKRIRGLQKLA